MYVVKVSILFAFLVSNSQGKSCKTGEFECKSGRCIREQWRCDSFSDCDDNSDEIDCQKGCTLEAKFKRGKVVVQGSKINGQKYKPGSIATFRCKKRYRLIGSMKSLCLENGEWSGFKAKCIKRSSKRVFCPVPKPLVNGTIGGNRVSVSAFIKYTCDKDFELKGPTRRICQRNGRWSREDPYCEPKYCPNPGPIPNGKVLGTFFSKGHSLRYICNDGYELYGEKTIKCLQDASWSDPPPRCITGNEALLNKAERFKKNFVNKLKVLTISGQGRSSLVSKAQGMDLVFLLDYSESVGQANFNRALDFVDSMIEYFGISSVREGTHVAVIVFAERPKLIFNLESTRVYEKKVALEELSHIDFSGGGTGTRFAFDLVIDNVLNQTRPFAKKVLFLLTDGNHNVGGDPAPSAKHLRDKGFEIFTVGISSYVNRKTLEELASLPFSKHVWLIKDFDMLQKLKELVNSSSVDYDACGIGGDTQSRGSQGDAVVTKHGGWPWTVIILVDGRARCAGVLLNNLWVLTAASCVKSTPVSNITVVSGISSRTNYTGAEQVRHVTKIVTNSKKVKGKFVHLALLKLENGVEFNEYTRTVCLPDEFDYLSYVRPYKYAYVVGWGDGESGTVAQKQGMLELALNTRCQGSYRKTKIIDYHLCARQMKDTNAACAGSIGSPLLTQRTRFVSGNRQVYSWVLVGIMQKSGNCKKSGSFALFTDVFYIKRWLMKTIKTK